MVDYSKWGSCVFDIVDIAELNAFPVQIITLDNGRCRAVLTDLGARLLELHVPDRDGQMADVVLGRATLGETFSDRNYLGSTAGRYAGRIREGRFSLAAGSYQLATNEGVTTCTAASAGSISTSGQRRPTTTSRP